MRHTLLIGLLCLSAKVFSQEVKIIPVQPSKEIPYLIYKDSLSAKEIINEIRRRNQWKGQVIDSVNGFLVYQLPLDGMKCLVPSADNPAMTNKMVKPMRKNDAAPIPNAIQPNQ